MRGTSRGFAIGSLVGRWNFELHEFYVKSTEDSWISRLPAKTFRWLIATTAGGALTGTPGLVAGAMIGGFDTFVVDEVCGGWKPQHLGIRMPGQCPRHNSLHRGRSQNLVRVGSDSATRAPYATERVVRKSRSLA